MSQTRQYFSELEKSIIRELVGKHKDVLESKRNDYRSIKQKTSAWETLTEEFNSQAGVNKRDSKQIKKCWENIKSRAKKYIAKEKREAKLTGGGTASSERDEGAAAVVSIIAAQMTSLDNPFDDDNYEAEILDGIGNEDEEESLELESTIATNENHPQTSEVIDESLKATSNRRCAMSAAQTRCLDMQEKQHTLEMEILEIRKNNLSEEHKRKMEVLDAELEYWSSTKKSRVNTQEEPSKRITRQTK